MELRPATLDDVDLLDDWDSKPHVIASGAVDGGHDWVEEISSTGDWQDLLIAELDGRAIGIVAIMDPALEPSRYWGDVAPGSRAVDIWIGEETDLGKGHGTRMMRLALQRCFASPDVDAVLIDPLVTNTDAHRFYRRVGFRDVEQRWFDGVLCLVMRLDRKDWET